MKTTQSPAQSAAAAIAVQPTVAVSAQPSQLVSSVLLECMAQIKSVYTKINVYYEANQDLRGCLQPSFSSIDKDLNCIACEIAEMMRVEMLESTFYGKEACNA